MKLLKPIVVLSLSTVILNACRSEIKESSTTISPHFSKILIDTTNVPLPISDLGDSISYILLKKSNGEPVGKVDKIDLFDGWIIILDKINSKSVSVFTSNGQFVYQKRAQKGELRKTGNLSDFFVDRSSKKLYILSEDSKILFVFNINDGRLIREIKLKGYFTNVAVADPNTILLLRDGLSRYKDYYGESRVCQIDSSGELIKKWIHQPLYPNGNFGDITPASQNGQILLSQTFNDTIYEYSNNKLDALYKIDLGFKSVPDELNTAKDQKTFIEMAMGPKSHYIQSGSMFSTKNLIVFYLKMGSRLCFYDFDKRTQKSRLSSYIINDLDNTSLPAINFLNDSLAISVINPTILQQQYNFVSSRSDFQEKFSTLIKLNKEITDESNPVIAVIRLK